MNNKIIALLDKFIWFTFLSSAIITPLFFTTANTELFEVPKMFIVYVSAVLLLALTSLKFIAQGKIQIPRSLVFYSLAAFVAIQIISTLTSIDKFTSVFGYPTRLNGGLLSQFAYLVIFTSALINLSFQKAQKLLLTMIVAAFAVALWGIPGHFGADPNCLILTGKLNATCWQKEFDPTARIFSTLGQPNWLASFIVMIIPLALSLLLISKKGSRLLPFVIVAALTLALLFTSSISGLLGLAVAVLIFSALIGTELVRKNFKIFLVAAILTALVLVGSGATLRSRIAEALTKPQSARANAGTSSGQIRLIVWQGAVAAFKARPILGFGPETFVYSYYQFRPQAHNLTTEWNFYYNKAHNEFLNYLANVGLLGFGGFLVFIGVSLFELSKIAGSKNPVSIWAKAVLASITGYFVTIFFGFSIVTTQLFMFLEIAAVLVMADSPIKVVNFKILGIARKTLAFTAAALSLWLFIFVLRLYFADILISRARNLGRLAAYESTIAVFPGENPFYLADYSHVLAVYATSQKDPKIAEILAGQTSETGEKSLTISPNNLLVLRKVKSAYDELSQENPIYKIKNLELAQREIALGPTDPTSYLDLAKAQRDIGKIEDAQKSAQAALALKPDYQEARDLLDQIQGKKLQ